MSCRADEHNFSRDGSLILCSKCGETRDLLKQKTAPKPRRTKAAPQAEQPAFAFEPEPDADDLEADIARMERQGEPLERIVERITSARAQFGNSEPDDPERRVPVPNDSDELGSPGL